jgi:hypothetical protein
MTRQGTRTTTALHEQDGPDCEYADDLTGVASRLANEARRLVPICTAAIAIDVGSRWQLLAQAGTVDVAADWRGTLAASTGGSAGSHRGDGYWAAELAGERLRALLILVAETEAGVPLRAQDTLGALLAGAGGQLAAARSAQQQDRAARRIELLSRPQPGVRPSRVTDEIEDTIASLWPQAAARFHDLGANRSAPSALRRLAQSAFDLDQPVTD